MWFTGKSIFGQPGDDIIDARRTLHVTIGLSAWLLLAGRILWRLRNPHPHASGQTRRIHVIAKGAHFVMLAAVAVMLVTGPLLAWAVARHPELATSLHRVHAMSANILGALVILHILGSLKHLLFHEDETIIRMLWPKVDRKVDSRPADDQTATSDRCRDA